MGNLVIFFAIMAVNSGEELAPYDERRVDVCNELACVYTYENCKQAAIWLNENKEDDLFYSCVPVMQLRGEIRIPNNF